MVKYKTVDMRTIEGIKKAEKLKENGWLIYSHSPDVIKFYKEITKK
jgi:hypothetical protein